MPEKAAEKRLEEYVSVFGKDRVESKEYSYEDGGQYSRLDDDDRIEKIDLDRLDGMCLIACICEYEFGCYLYELTLFVLIQRTP